MKMQTKYENEGRKDEKTKAKRVLAGLAEKKMNDQNERTQQEEEEGGEKTKEEWRKGGKGSEGSQERERKKKIEEIGQEELETAGVTGVNWRPKKTKAGTTTKRSIQEQGRQGRARDSAARRTRMARENKAPQRRGWGHLDQIIHSTNKGGSALNTQQRFERHCLGETRDDHEGEARYESIHLSGTDNHHAQTPTKIQTRPGKKKVHPTAWQKYEQRTRFNVHQPSTSSWR